MWTFQANQWLHAHHGKTLVWTLNGRNSNHKQWLHSREMSEHKPENFDSVWVMFITWPQKSPEHFMKSLKWYLKFICTEMEHHTTVKPDEKNCRCYKTAIMLHQTVLLLDIFRTQPLKFCLQQLQNPFSVLRWRTAVVFFFSSFNICGSVSPPDHGKHHNMH